MIEGKEAKKILTAILDTGTGNFGKDNMGGFYSPPYVCGVFLFCGRWTAFDNRKKRCNVEDFKTREKAVNWINLGD